jgi:hypothetical protein
MKQCGGGWSGFACVYQVPFAFSMQKINLIPESLAVVCLPACQDVQEGSASWFVVLLVCLC